ncbi:hypothetical protein GCM10008026_13570 [Chelatococcus composti]|nr:hypothetical protein GCM10008026_13570 [Chelatococcus composti]
MKAMALCSIGRAGQAPGTSGPSAAGLCRLAAGGLILGWTVVVMPPAAAQSPPMPPADTGHPAAGPASPMTMPCTCRAQGRDYEIGAVVCLSTSAGPRLATCGMELNNTSWKLTSEPCPDA